jgi:hypothetical protein
MAPSIGRIAIFHSPCSGDRAAIITEIVDDNYVSLHIFYTKRDMDAWGRLEPDVSYVGFDINQTGSLGTWRWPERKV